MTSIAIKKKIDDLKRYIEADEACIAAIDSGKKYWRTKGELNREIRKYEDNIRKYELQYNDATEVETEANKKRNIQPIIDFLTEWGKLAYDFDAGLIKEYKKDKELERELENALKHRYPDHRGDFCDRDEFEDPDIDEYIEVRERLHGKRDIRVRPWGKEWDYRQITKSRYIGIERYLCPDGDIRLREDIREEASAKYDDLIYRVQKYVGEIKGARDLTCGKNGSLNGYIYGEEKEIYLETIIASGPVQRAHYRVIIHKVN